MPGKKDGSRTSSTEERLYVVERKDWRAWLRANHRSKVEIWLVYFRKDSGKPRISYNDAVEEALCWGWIDSVVHPIDAESYSQRFSPRRPTSMLSALNLERIRVLVERGQMTKAGLRALEHVYDPETDDPDDRSIPPDIEAALRAEPDAWRYFTAFPAPYQRIRVAFVDGSRQEPEVFAKRLANLVKRSARNERFGFVPEWS